MPRPDEPAKRRLLESWDANAGAWSETIARGTESRRAGTDAAVLRATLRALAAAGGGAVLDAGCGEGWLMRALRTDGVCVEGMDGSANLARAAGARHLTYAEAVAGPDRMGGPFAVVVFSFALLDNEPAEILRAARSRLKDSGRIVIQTLHPLGLSPPYAPGWREETFAGFGDASFEPMPWFFHTLASWSAALGDAGLALERIDEPRHPETDAVLSLVMTAQRSAT